MTLLDRMRQNAGATSPSTEAEQRGQIGWDVDLIPDLDGYQRTEEDDEIDRVIRSIDIVDAYRRWCGKMEPQVGNKRESIMVSCPFPDHADNNPSAWVNLDKNTGNCPLCGGFDPIILFGWHMGLDPHTDFPDLRRKMAEDLGYTVKRTAGGQEYVEQSTAPRLVVVPDPRDESDEAGADVVEFDFSGDDYFAKVPPIDWRCLVDGRSTFLRKWMDATSEDDLPEEFYFWLGLQAIGCATGNKAVLDDTHPVRGNLLTCLVGPSGQGKTKSLRALTMLLRESMPYEPGNTGTKIIGLPGSGESLVDQFVEPVFDLTAPKEIVGYSPVRGLVRASELASLTKKAGRSGSTIQPTIMDFFDSDEPVSAHSRGAGNTIAVDHYAQFVSTTQPKLMRDLLSDADANSGFVNRWVFVIGQPKKRFSFGGGLIDLSACVDPLRGIRSWAGSGRKLRPSAAALERWDEFFHSTVVGIVESDDAVTSRIDLLMKKLMLLLTADKKESEVSLETVEQVIDLFPYLYATYTSVSEQVGSNDDRDCEEEILAAIERCMVSKKIHPGTREIQRAMGRKFEKFGRERVLKALERLIKLGEVNEYLSDNKSGPRRNMYGVAK